MRNSAPASHSRDRNGQALHVNSHLVSRHLQLGIRTHIEAILSFVLELALGRVERSDGLASPGLRFSREFDVPRHVTQPGTPAVKTESEQLQVSSFAATASAGNRSDDTRSCSHRQPIHIGPIPTEIEFSQTHHIITILFGNERQGGISTSRICGIDHNPTIVVADFNNDVEVSPQSPRGDVAGHW